jgi:hypothetical protein
MTTKQNPEFPTRRPNLANAPGDHVGLAVPRKRTGFGASVLSAQASKYPCDFKTELPVPNWKQAHLTWPPNSSSDWPSGVSPIAANSPLLTDSAGKVFFVGTDGKVYNYYWEDDYDWEIQALNWNQWAQVDPAGGLSMNNGKIYCIGTDKKVYNFYYENGAWQFDALVTNQNALVYAKGGLTFDQTGKVFVIGTDGKVYNYYWTGSAWAFHWLNPNQSPAIDARGKLLVDSLGKVYAIGVDGKVYNYYWTGSSWAFDWLVPNPYASTDPIGGLKIDETGKLFVIGTDGKVYNYYWTGSIWAFDSLSPLQTDAARPSNQLATGGDAVYFVSQSGHLEVFYYSAEQINYNDWDLLYDENFTTTSLTSLQNDWLFPTQTGHTQSGNILAGYQFEYNWDQALSISSGNLHITANNQPIWAKLVDWLNPNLMMSDGKTNYRQFNFTGGVVTTKAAYTYGLFEINCRFPAGRGFWPAFWLSGANSWPPEIDVLEFVGAVPLRCSNNVHWRINPNATESCGMDYGTSQDLSKSYHKYSMAWFPEKIIMYFDGRELRTIDHHVPQTPMQIIVNLAIGLDYPDQTTPFPSSFDVDYVRFYKHK